MIRDRSINQVLISIKCRIRNKRPIAIFTNCQSFDQSINQTIDQLIDWSIMITNLQSTNTRIFSVEFMKEKTFNSLRVSLWHPQRSWGDILLFYVSFCFFYFYYFSSTHFCPVWNSNVNGPKKMELYHNVNHQMKICFLGVALSRWLPLPWKQNKCEKIQLLVLVNCLDLRIIII